MSNSEYVMDTKIVEETSDTISTAAADYLRIIDDTTAIVDDLASHWEGESYQLFRNEYYNHLSNLEELNSSLKTLAGDLYENAERTRSTVNAIRAHLN